MSQKYFLFILGCAMNYSDAERIASVLEMAGYQSTAVEAEADIIVTVACSVRQVAIDRIHGKVKGWNKKRRKNSQFKTILSGCVLPQDKKSLTSSFDLMFEINELQKLADFLKVEMLDRRDYLATVPKHESSFRAYVPIMTGCDNFCSYCAVPYTRGREVSRPPEEIMAEVEKLIQNGYKEITLLGQNVNSYQGYGTKVVSGNQFTNLLEEIDKIPGDYRVYFYSNHPKDVSDTLLKTLPTLQHFPAYLHLPLQSGNDEILKQMNRHYSPKQYLELVKKIRQAMPEVVLTTDIIVGFPGEDERKFADTVKVMKEAEFEMAFIAQYSPRPGTLSSKMVDDVSQEIKKERFKTLTGILREHLGEVNKKFIGKTVRVLVDEKKSGKFFGRTEGYKVVEIKTDLTLEVGQFYEAEISTLGAWKLVGKI